MAMEAYKVRKALEDVQALKSLDVEVLEYLCGMLADSDFDASPEAIASQAGPFLESCWIAEDEESIARVSKQMFDAMVANGSAKVADKKAKVALGGGGLSLDTAAALRALVGGEEEEAPTKMLAAPVKLGGKVAGAGDTALMDMLWGRSKGRGGTAGNQNKTIEYDENSKEARKAAKAAAKADTKEAMRAKIEADRDALAVAMRDGKAVTSGSVTYVPVVDRKAQDISMTGVNIGYGGEYLLQDCELKLNQGRRYGLVARNGYGKTTLLKHMARHDIQGAGAQRFPTNIRVLHVEQEISGNDTTVLETVLAADVERDVLVKEEAAIMAQLQEVEAGASAAPAAPAPAAGDEDGSTVTGATSITAAATADGSSSAGARQAEVKPFDADAAQARLRTIAARLEAIDSATAEARASAILAGLQFTNEMQGWPTSALSGGWRMRVALACALFVQPDVLLLDEPTNHLDVPSVMWLENYLHEYPNTAVIVSHDRRFLNNVVTDVMHLENKKLVYYKGDYDTFERTRAEKKRHADRAAETADAKRAHVQAFIDKFRYNAKRASLVQSRIKALERMAVLDDAMVDDPRWRFEFPDPGPLGTPVLQVVDVAFGYDTTSPLFRGVNFGVGTDSRVAIVGPNGAGKSTLIKLILGELQPQSGHVARNSKLRTACFTQHHVAQLDLTLSPLDYLMRLFPGNKPDTVRAHLSAFGLAGDLALQRIGTLSGGQKSRVAFSVCSWKKPHVLVLDEPTNHLDLDTIDALIVALGQFAGGVILVSHDQHFIESVADEIWVVGEGKVSRFRGEFKDYRKVALGERAARGAGGH